MSVFGELLTVLSFLAGIAIGIFITFAIIMMLGGYFATNEEIELCASAGGEIDINPLGWVFNSCGFEVCEDVSDGFSACRTDYVKIDKITNNKIPGYEDHGNISS